MASKNTIALFLTINLVLFSFTVAQTPPPQASTCPRNLQACVNLLNIGVTINPGAVRPCCLAVAGLPPPVASVCLCNAVNLSILNVVSVNLAPILSGLCRISPPRGFTCA